MNNVPHSDSHILSRCYMILFSIMLSMFPLWGKASENKWINYTNFNNITMPIEENVTMIASITQDYTGIIWVGTNCGIFSYDGYSMRYHSQIVCSGHIYCMKDVKNDALYVGTDHGLWAYDHHQSNFRKWIEGSPNDIRSIVEDGDKLWLGTSTGLYRYDIKSRQFEKYGSGKLGNDVIYALLKASDGNIYIGTYNGLYYYDQQRGYFRNIELPLLSGKSNVFVNALIEDPSRKCIWIGTGGRLYRYGLTTNRWDYIPELEKNSVKSFSIDKDNNLLIGTDNGLYIYQDNQPIHHIQHDSRQSNHSLINDVVWCIYNDTDGNVWIGTDEGISVTQKKHGMEFIPIASFTGIGKGNHFQHILGDKNRKLWLGGSDGLICTDLTLKSGATWYSVDTPGASIAHNRIRRIYEDKDGDLWICTDGGVHLWKDGHWKQINLSDSTSKRNANWAYDIHEDGKGRIWVASFMGGLMVVDKQKLVASQYNCQPDTTILLPGNKGQSPFQMIEDKERNLWVLYYNDGLWKISTSTFSAEKVEKIEKELCGDAPSHIYSDYRGCIWIGLPGKIICVNDNIISYQLGYEQGENVSWITEVGDELWVGTKTGIWAITNQGVVRKNTNIGPIDAAYYDTMAGLLYLGSIDGLYIGKPEDIRNNLSSHSILLTGVYVDNHPVSPADAKKIVFTPDQRHIAFTISDLPYTNGEKSEFLYRLVGIDNGWISLPKDANSITFNNLNYGSYTLEVCRFGISGEPADILVIPFEIQYPWYLRWWAISLYIIMCMAFIGWCFIFYRMRNQLKYEQMEKEHILEQLRLKMEIHPDLKQAAELAEPQPIVADDAETISVTDKKFIKEVTDTIDAHLADSDLNVQSLCEYLGMGNKLVYRRLKQLTGKTPVEYIRSIRLTKAAALLKQKKFTISEVMYLSGFSNASYFSKCFLAEYGCSPREYMEKV